MNAVITKSAPEATFDPAEWLSRFESLGGGYTVNPEGELSIGYLLRGFSDADRRAACRMVTGLTTDDKDALRAHLLGKRDGIANPDALIIDAWNRRGSALRAIRALPLNTPDDSAAMREAWAVVDTAETLIHQQTARTLEGVEIQLWIAAYHISDGLELEVPIGERDLAAVLAKMDDLDFDLCAVIAAIRSIRAMEV